MHGCKCTGANAMVRAETQGPLRGEAYKAKSLGSASHDASRAALGEEEGAGRRREQKGRGRRREEKGGGRREEGGRRREEGGSSV